MSDTAVHVLDRTPAEGECREIAPGVRWVRMPLPFSGLDHINLWLLADGEGWTIIDSGLGTRRVMELWEEIFARELDGRPVTRLICTHFHPDHLGQAGWLVERWNVELWMTLGEWSFGRMLWLDAMPEVPDDVLRFYRRLGLDAAMLAALKQRGFGNYRKGVREIPRAIRRLADGQVVRIGANDWRVTIGRGHSLEHACLYAADLGVLISGDQILPRISPHIGVYPGEPEADPLRHYLESLPRFAHLPAETLVLPSHNLPFVGLQDRLESLAGHHVRRLERLRAALDRPKTAVAVMPALFDRALGPDSAFLALAETVAHLNHEMHAGRIRRTLDADGAYRYARAAPDA